MLEVQRLAVQVVGNVLSGRSLDTELRTVWASGAALSPQERSALQDIAFGTLRFLGQIDAVLAALLERPLKDERIRHLLRIALFQLVHTRAAPHAIVDHAVRTTSALAKPAAKGLVNAVLRNFLRRRDAVLAEAQKSEVGRYSHPQWWIDALRSQYPEHYGEMLDSANKHPPLTLRVNSRRTAVDAYRELLTREGMDSTAIGGSAVMLDKPVPVDRIPGFSDGAVSVQDAAAQYAAVLLDAHAGQRVLDACAAPGGKTAHMLERADLDLTALDNDEARLTRIESNLSRLSVSAKLVHGDAAQPDAWWDGKPFDAILADVPCSASGVVRRHPDIKWLRRKNDIAQFAQRQREILASLWRLLATDGKLLYATCSVFHEENHDQIRWFLETHRDARHLTLPAPHTSALQLAGQILPDERHDGFYYALLQKA